MDKFSKRILVIRTGHLGDVLMITPVVRKLKKIYPGCCIDFVTSEYAKVVLEANQNVDRIFVYRKNKRIVGKIKKFFFERSLAGNKYDICIVFEQHPQYHQFARNIMGGRGITIGLESMPVTNFLEQTLAYKPDHQHIIETSLFLIRNYLKATIDTDDYLMDFFIPDEVKKKMIPSLLDWRAKSDKYFVIHQGCSGNQFWRTWVPANCQAAIRFLNEKGFRVFLTGTTSEKPVIEDIIKNGGFTDAEVEAFTGHHLHEVAFLIKHATGVLSPDTGIMHIARAMQVPVVGLFGPSNPLHTGCIGRGKYIQIRNDFKCGPCDYYPQYRLEYKQQCIDEGKFMPPACMRSISVEQVMDALREIIRSVS